MAVALSVVWMLGGLPFGDTTSADDKAAATAAVDFDGRIAPLLAARCLECHNAMESKGGLNLSTRKTALAGGDSGAALVIGKPDGSLLWDRISRDEMPPKRPLTHDEKELLRRWIASGANWGTDPIDPFRITTGSRAGYDWWSLQPITRPMPPPDDTGWARTPIDGFVLGKLREAGLSPSPEADRRTLIRRLSFDLLGLPPTPAEIIDFEADSSPDAYEKLVERLLASPHYGERWARHWLDVVRFGESQGFERDKLRTNSWRYRDWVVDAFNSDLPYDEFVRLQLAGDVLRPDDPSAIIATGFLVAGPYDEVGQTQQSEAMKRVVRQDELEELVGSVSQTFLGLTVNCARCHDHKFDPIRQKEYYRVAAALAGVRHGERPVGGPALQAEAASFAAGFSARIAALQHEASGMEGRIRRELLEARRANPAAPTPPPEPIARWDFHEDFRDSLGGLHASPTDGAKVVEGRLVLDGKGHALTEPLASDLREKSLEAWVQLADLDQQGGGVFGVQTRDGAQFDAIVFGEREPARWMAGSNLFLRSESFQGPAETEAAKQLVHFAVVYAADGTITAYRDGLVYGKPYQSKGLVKFTAGEARILFGLRHTPPGGNKHLKGTIDCAQLYDRALTADEVAASAGVSADYVSPESITAKLMPQQRVRRDQIRFEIPHLERLRDRAQSMKVYAVVPRAPEATHLLRRGNPADPQEAVTAGGVASVKGAAADFGLDGDAADADRRRRLAAWITDPHNPLFARVIVNRLWHYHFGTGIVETCNDFGFNGGRPSHPALLEWLAAEFGDRRPEVGGQGRGNTPISAPSASAFPDLRPLAPDLRLKRLHRFIVTSATYRQSSRERPVAMRTDAGNRLLWRRSPQRLEAEAVRDTMLAAAGDLNPELGGPGYEDFTTFVRNSQFYEPVDAAGVSFERRSIYRTWVRSGRSPFLDVFDCPDPSTMTPQRAVTTTPLQALSLLNNSFALRMSDHLADRLRREAGDDLGSQIDRGSRLVYGRAPTKEELAVLGPFARRHGLAALCRVWFNSNEFLYVD